MLLESVEPAALADIGSSRLLVATLSIKIEDMADLSFGHRPRHGLVRLTEKSTSFGRQPGKGPIASSQR